MIRAALGFLKRDFSINLSYRANFILHIVAVFLMVTGIYFLNKVFNPAAIPALRAYKGNYFAFLILGVAFFDFLTVSVVGFANSIREGQLTGTLEVMLLSPTKLPIILIGSSLWSYLFTLIRFLFYLLFGFLFGFSVGQANLLGALLIIFLAVLSFAGVGMISASFILVLKRGDPLGILFASLSAIFGGVFYPTNIFPPWLEKLSSFIPLTHALRGVRKAVINGSGIAGLWSEMLALLIFAVIVLPMGFFLFSLAAKRAKTVGTLTQY